MRDIFEGLSLKPYGATPNERQIEWYKRKRMIFLHFGMNTFTGKEWGDGTESPALFNPTELDVYQWVRTAKDAGFGAVILTAKHHDGFCLWPSKYTEHSIKNSPYKNGKGDIVREFTDACASLGVKAGIYLSPWDRHEPSWGKEEYNDFYVGQLSELLSNYGKIWECWWDGAGSTEAVYDWERWARTVRALQGDAVIFGSLGATPWVDVRWVGNEKGVAGKPCYATIDAHSLVVENTAELNRGKLGGERFIPAEVDVSIRPGWFYHAEQDSQVRSSANLIDLWFDSVGRGAGLLLNLPPDRRGLIHENDVASLLEFNDILTRALSSNLALGATVRASSVRDGCLAQDILSDTLFYAPQDNNITPCVEISFENEIEFNAFSIGEVIELGHKITKIRISACIDGEWRVIGENECVGARFAQRTPLIKSNGIKIEVLSALDTPVLRGFGLYKFDDSVAKCDTSSNGNLLEASYAEVKIEGNTIEANLGGVFPFNQIKVLGVGACEYRLLIFNGSSFDTLLEGRCEDEDLSLSFDTVDYSYRFKLVLDKAVSTEQIEVFYLQSSTH
ncbi:MAG: alpha-L-fucosidase [Clostridia bacterium]|nr:alpha-L-fucosidase [Clostridia bacterium]